MARPRLRSPSTRLATAARAMPSAVAIASPETNAPDCKSAISRSSESTRAGSELERQVDRARRMGQRPDGDAIGPRLGKGANGVEVDAARHLDERPPRD